MAKGSGSDTCFTYSSAIRSERNPFTHWTAQKNASNSNSEGFVPSGPKKWECSPILGPQSHFGDNWGQMAWNLSGVPPKRDWSSNRVKRDVKVINLFLLLYWLLIYWRVVGSTVYSHSRARRATSQPSINVLVVRIFLRKKFIWSDFASIL